MTALPKSDGPANVVWRAGIVLAILFVGMLNTVPLSSNDLWLQLKIGHMIVADGVIPRTLLFPFTSIRDTVFNSHEWLSSVIYSEMERLAGEQGLMVVQGLFAMAQFALSFVLARGLSRSNGAALLLAMLAMLTVNFRYVLRPELIALLLLVLLLMVLTHYRATGRRIVLAWALPIGVLWANCHGSFLLGPGIAAIFAGGEGLSAALGARQGGARERAIRAWQTAWPYAGAALGLVAASLLNPRGPELLGFAFHVQSSGASRALIKEWLPTLHPLFVESPAFWIFAAVLAASLALLAKRWRDVTPTEAILFALFVGLALQSNRHIAWFPFVALAVCAGVLGRRETSPRAERGLRLGDAALALAGVLACTLFGNVRGAFVYASPSNNFSPAMVAELARPDLVGNVLTSYELGSELIYRDWPRLRPSIDSREDSYGDAYFLAHQRMLTNEAELRGFVTGYGVNHMLLLRRDFMAGIRGMPSIAAEWHIRFADADMLLLERNVAFPAQPSRP